MSTVSKRGVTHAHAVCRICDAMHGAARAYVANVLCHPQHLEVNAEAISDAVGFCGRHAAVIAEFEDGAQAISAVLERALAAVSALFDGRPGGEERLKDLLFSAPGACPACAFEDRQLTALLSRHAARLRGRDGDFPRTLCLPHFHGLIAESELADLREWAAMESACLSAVASAVDGGGPGAFAAATRLIAGRRPAKPTISLAGGCRVCEAISAARKRWLILVRESLRTDAAPEMLLPMCGEHIWMCHSSGDARLAEWATRKALEIAVRKLRHAAARVQDEERRLERSKASVWYRAKNPAYILGQRRRMVTDMPRCPACQRIAIARDRAVSQVLEQLRDQRERDALEQEGGLCMKHFACARIVAPAGTVRDALTTAQIRQLQTLLDQFGMSAEGLRERVLCFLSDAAS